MKATHVRTELLVLLIVIVVFGIATGASAGVVCCPGDDARQSVCGPSACVIADGTDLAGICDVTECDPEQACILIDGCGPAGNCDQTGCSTMIKARCPSDQPTCVVPKEDCARIMESCPAAKECCPSI